jgi:hypothetical protein
MAILRRLLIFGLLSLFFLALFPLMFFSDALPTSRFSSWKDFGKHFISGQVHNKTSHPIRILNHMVYRRDEQVLMPNMSSRDLGMHDVDSFKIEKTTVWNNQRIESGKIFRMCDFANVTIKTGNDGLDEIELSLGLTLCEWKNKLFEQDRLGHRTGAFGTEVEAFNLSEKAQRVMGLR